MKLRSIETKKMEYLNNVVCQNINFLLDHYGIKYKDHSGSLIFACPVHGGDNTTALNFFLDGHTKIGNWVCYTHNCQNHFINTSIGFFRGVVSNKKFGWSKSGDKVIDFKYIISELCDILKIDLSIIKEGTKIESLEKHAHVFAVKPNIQPTNYTRKMVREKLTIPSEYFVSRGYDAAILDKYDVGDSISNNRIFKNRAVVPIYDSDNKHIVGFTGRIKLEKCISCNNFHEEKQCDPQKNLSKWIHSKGFSKKNYLYNYGNAKESIMKKGFAILVEGPADVWKFLKNGIENVVAVFGSSLSDSQQIILESSGATSLVLLFDSDKAGSKASDQLSLSLSRTFKIIKLSLPNGIKDPGDLSDEQINHIFNPYSEGCIQK